MIGRDSALAGTGQCRVAADHQAGSLVAFESGGNIDRFPTVNSTQRHASSRVRADGEKKWSGAGPGARNTRDMHDWGAAGRYKGGQTVVIPVHLGPCES